MQGANVCSGAEINGFRLNTMAASTSIMEQPPVTPLMMIVNTIAEYWKAIVGAIGAVALIWGYIKLLHGKGKAIIGWLRKAVATPDAVLTMQAELTLDGKTLRQAVIDLGADLKNLTLFLNAETKWRRAILDSIDEPIFEADKDGRFMWANEKMLIITDFDMAQIVGNNWRNFITGRDRAGVVEGWNTAVRDCADYRTTFRLAGPGEDKWFLFDAVCNKDEFGNVLNFIGKLKSISGPPTQINVQV